MQSKRVLTEPFCVSPYFGNHLGRRGNAGGRRVYYRFDVAWVDATRFGFGLLDFAVRER